MRLKFLSNQTVLLTRGSLVVICNYARSRWNWSTTKATEATEARNMKTWYLYTGHGKGKAQTFATS